MLRIIRLNLLLTLMERVGLLFVYLFLAIVVSTILQIPSDAQPICTIEQITNETTGDTVSSSISSDGIRIAFSSEANINGNNLDGNFELYLYDINSKTISQLTNITTVNNKVDSSNPSINDDGTIIAFVSDADINGNNPDMVDNLYLYEVNSGAINQITNFGDFDGNNLNLAPSINSDGTRIAFSSDANINGGNADGSMELYLYNANTALISQLTDDKENEEFQSDSPSINSDGTRIAYRSDAKKNG